MAAVDSSSAARPGNAVFRAVLDARRSERIKVAITMGRVQQLAINWR
jgi:hypothetical protein